MLRNVLTSTFYFVGCFQRRRMIQIGGTHSQKETGRGRKGPRIDMLGI